MTVRRIIEIIAKGGIFAFIILCIVGAVCAAGEAIRDFFKYKKYEK